MGHGESFSYRSSSLDLVKDFIPRPLSKGVEDRACDVYSRELFRFNVAASLQPQQTML